LHYVPSARATRRAIRGPVPVAPARVREPRAAVRLSGARTIWSAGARVLSGRQGQDQPRRRDLSNRATARSRSASCQTALATACTDGRYLRRVVIAGGAELV